MTSEEALAELESFAAAPESADGKSYISELAAIIRADLGVRERVLNLWDNNDAWIPGCRSRDLADALGVPHKRMLTHRDGGFSRPGVDFCP